MTQLKVGQIWEFGGPNGAPKRTISDKKEILQLTGPLTALEIVTIGVSRSGCDDYHTCSILRDDSGIFTLALKDNNGYLIMVPDKFDEAVADGEWVLLMDVVSSPKMGARCIKCKQDYPYANYADDFKCWGCRKGF